ncbi:MAG: flagellar motor switch protein FliM [Paracoccaceae bacterium]
MSTSSKLSKPEVDALIAGLDGDAAAGVDATLASGEKRVRDFKFGSDDLSLLGDYYALRVINERFARFSRGVFQPMLRVQPRVTALNPSVTTFEDYSFSSEPFMSLTLARIEMLRGNLMMVISPELISKLTNAYYGGNLGIVKTLRRSEFTSTEDRIIEIITDGLIEALDVAWSELIKLEFSEVSREENLQFVSFVEDAEQIICCTFEIQLPGTESASFDVLYPLQTLKPIAAQLRSRMQSDSVDSLSWTERLQNAVFNVPLSCTARLTSVDRSMAQVLQFQVDDILPITINGPLELVVEEREFFEAELGDVGGTLAISLLKQNLKNK